MSLFESEGYKAFLNLLQDTLSFQRFMILVLK
jgi:hypothetical protein